MDENKTEEDEGATEHVTHEETHTERTEVERPAEGTDDSDKENES